MTHSLFRTRLKRGFEALRKRGYFARQNWQCCNSCGCAALPTGTERYVFYHAQDDERMRSIGSVYLTWGGDGYEIWQCFLEAGLAVTWDGRSDTRILVSPPEIDEVPSKTDDAEYGECVEALLNC